MEEHGFLTALPEMRDAIEGYGDIARQKGLNMDVSPMPLPKAKLPMIMTALLMKPELLTDFIVNPASLEWKDVIQVYIEYQNKGVGW